MRSKQWVGGFVMLCFRAEIVEEQYKQPTQLLSLAYVERRDENTLVTRKSV